MLGYYLGMVRGIAREVRAREVRARLSLETNTL
jgi:hypothetical protein